MKQKISSVGKPELIKTSTIKSAVSNAFSENISKKLGFLSGAIILIDVIDDHEVRASHIINGGMIIVAGVPVVGWMIGGSYFLADIATLAITGNSIGGHIDNAIDEPLMSWTDD